MSRLLPILALIVIALPAVALDDQLTARAPVKPDRVVVPPPADPEVIRQGGDTIEDATIIDAIPYDNVGTTAGYTDDYDESCPYTFSNSPDVIYTFTPADGVELDIDLCGSSYDTKLYVYDEGLNLVACNDDFYFDDECGTYVSFLHRVPMSAGMQYYIIIDGHCGDFGDYILEITENEVPEPCDLECPQGGIHEGEPDLVDGYVDNYNGGCNSDGPPWPFQSLNELVDFCGVAGWYTYQGSNFRDTDWFTARAWAGHPIFEVTVDAESATNVFALDITEDCDAGVLQSMTVGPCAPATMMVFGTPDSDSYLWVGSANFTNPGDVPDNMYDYLLSINWVEETATESSTWSQVKGLYR